MFYLIGLSVKRVRTTPVHNTLGGTFQTVRKTHVAFQLVQFAPNRTVTHEVAILEDDNRTKKDEARPDMIIGRDLIKALGLSLDFSVEPPTISWEDSSVPVVPKGYWTKEKILETFPISAIDQAEKSFEEKSPSMIAASYNSAPVDLREFVPNHLSPNQQSDLYSVLTQYGIVFDGELGTLPGKPIELQLKSDDVRPYHGCAYPVPKIHEKLIKDEVDRLCRLGVLRRVNESEWGAPSFGIPKKNGQIRFVSDFRQLNKGLRRTPYPLSVPQEIFRTMDGFEYCTTMDLNMGFWAICLSPYSQQLCTIVLPWGKYCYLRLPMGLAVSPDVYQEKMAGIFSDMPEVIVYIDDICIITKGAFQDHVKVLREVLHRLAKNGLKVHADKSKFCCFETEFLGFVLSREGIRPQQKKVEAILALSEPKNVRQVRSILGFLNYYKQFIPHRSELLAPITALTKKETKFVWTTKCQKNLDTVKQMLSRKVTLSYPNFNQPFSIYTDASTRQLGAVIEQNGKPLAFYSRKLNDAQTRYTVTELELLSIVETLQEFRTTLLGHEITIYTDHKNLTYDNFTTDRVRRWRLIVEEYGPKIEYIKGHKNVIADMLSRYPRKDDASPEEIHEIWAIDEIEEEFPLAFEVIAQAQQQDQRLNQIARNNPDYSARRFLRQNIIHYKDKIVIPDTLQKRIITWYHESLRHPGISRTTKTIQQHFHWKNLTKDVEKHCNECAVCKHYKKYTQQYGILPTKIHDPNPWSKVCIDMSSPWTIPQAKPKAKRGKTTTKANKEENDKKELLVLTIMDPDTNFLDMIAMPSKASMLVARAFDRLWLCRYPRPFECIHDAGTEFTGLNSKNFYNHMV